MPNTKLTKKRLNNHFHYSKWIYILIAVVSWVAIDLTFSITAYRAPADRKVDIEVVGSYVNIDGLLPFAEAALSVGQAADPTLEEVNFYSIAYSGEDDMYGIQKFVVMLGAQEGHIYIVGRSQLEQLVSSGAALPLEGYIESGALAASGLDLSEVTFAEPAEEEGQPEGPEHVYALPASGLNRMLEEDISYDNRDKYLVVMAYAPNPDTTVAVLNSLLEQLTAPLPDWAAELPDEQALAAEQEALLSGVTPEPTAP